MATVADLKHAGASHADYVVGYPLATHTTNDMIEHVKSLMKLFASDVPLMVPLRPTDSHNIRSTVGDASAEGFSIATQYPDISIKF